MTARKSSWAKAALTSLASLFASSRRKQPYRTRLLVELLEDRCVPTTFTPTTFADGVLGSGSLRDAVLQFNADAGTDDDTILLEAGTYALTIPNIGGHHETAGLTGDLNLTQTSHRWVIHGTGPSTVIDASELQDDRVFQIVNPGTVVVFQNLVIQGGLAQDNGSNGALAGTTDALGGGILNNGANITLDHVVIQNNVARGGDAAALSTPGHNASGGGIYSTGGALTIAGATIANNQTIGGRGGDTGAFYRAGDGGNASGGGLYATGGSLDIANSTIASNGATGGRGGDIMFCGSTGCPYVLGGAGQGGGLYVNGSSLTIATSTIASNQGTGGPAGLSGFGGLGLGGGLYNGGTLTVSNSTLSGNSAGLGAGIFNDSGTLTVSNSTLSGNSAGLGAGIFNYNFGTLTVSNSTLSGNSASSGGGIYTQGTAVTLANVTLTANRANTGLGGGLYVFVGAPVLHNTLIAGNFRGATGTTRDDVNGALNPGGDYNLIGDGTGMTGLSNGVNGNLVGSAVAPIDPLVGPLQDNGGPTLTHALLVGSPAIDAGDNTGATAFDQRGPGFPRIVNGVIDIGAYEFNAGTHFQISVPGSVTAGMPFALTFTALTGPGAIDINYSGTVRFTSTDGQATLPVNYTFTTADAGMHTFSGLILRTADSQTITARDTANAASPGTAAATVFPVAVSTLTFTDVPSTLTAGHAINLTVSARDPFNNIITSYRGTVTFASTDSQATLPANYTFTAADAGVHNFAGVIFRTAGSRTVMAQDTADGTIAGSVTVTVNPAAADHFSVSAPGSVTAGVAFSISVTALDALDNTVLSYARTVHFTSSDQAALLPDDYTFTAADQGVHTFTDGVTLSTPGKQTVTATGTSTSIPELAGIISWWPGDGNANDIVGGNDGTLHGGVTFAPGEVGQAFSFNGTSAYVSIPFAPNLALHTFTVQAWVNPAATAGDLGILGTRFGGEYTFDLKLSHNGVNLVHGDVGTGTYWISTSVDYPATLAPGTWHLVSYVIDNGAQRFSLYLDGTLQNTISFGGTPLFMTSAETMEIGNSWSGPGEYFNGLIDEVTIYNRPLSTAEIRAIYDAGSAGQYQTITGSASVNVTEAPPSPGSTGAAHGVRGAAPIFTVSASEPAPVRTSPTPLWALVTEWTGIDEDYATRVAYLLGSSGVPPLDAMPLTSDAGRHTLAGHASRAPFFASALDQIDRDSLMEPFNDRYLLVFGKSWKSSRKA
jgi:hypothetical protein